MKILQIVEACTAFRLNAVFSGSVAAHLSGYMLDDSAIELLIPKNVESFKKVEKALKKLGLENSLPVGAEEIFHFLHEFQSEKKIKFWTFHHPKVQTEKIQIRLDHFAEEFTPIPTRIENFELHFLALEDCKKLGARFEDETPMIKSLSHRLIIERFDNLRFYHRLEAKKEFSKSKLISMKVPQNLLDAFKQKSEYVGIPYQTQIKKLMKDWLS
ncbi:MAG: hypothetical protein ACK5V3_05410 [Bdellovibrionales bacterium]